MTGQAGQRLLLVYPPPPLGAIIAREPQCRCERRCPESAYINIIPSGLCNSRRHRQCSASRESVKHTPGARRTVLQGVRLHNPDYVKYAPSVSCECPTSELPGEAAAGEGLAAVVGLHPALCQPRAGQRNRGPNFPNSSTSAPSRIAIVLLDRHLPHSASKQCEHPAALRSSAAGSFQAVTPLPPQAPSEESRPSTPR